MNSEDQLRILRFESVLAAGLPRDTGNPPPEVHAEFLHQLCLADAILEVLEWSSHGTASDPLGSMWLGALRWHRALVGNFPEGAPEPASRPSDYALELIINSGGLHVKPGTAEASLAGLSAGEMAYPTDPAQPEETDDGALLRVIPLALVPYVDQASRHKWAEQALGLTHGHPGLTATALRILDAFQSAVSGEAVSLDLDSVSANVAARISLQLHAVTDEETHTAGDSLLGVVVSDLTQRWHATLAS